jgi:hypothetical protein
MCDNSQVCGGGDDVGCSAMRTKHRHGREALPWRHYTEYRPPSSQCIPQDHPLRDPIGYLVVVVVVVLMAVMRAVPVLLTS